MMIRFATMLVLTIAIFPSRAGAQAATGETTQPPAVDPAPRAVGGPPKLSVSGGYQSSSDDTKGWYADVELGSRRSTSIVAEFSSASHSESYAYPGTSFVSQARSLNAMLGQRVSFRFGSATILGQVSGGVRRYRSENTFTNTFRGQSVTTSSGRTSTDAVADFAVGASVKILKGIQLRASGGLLYPFSGGFGFILRYSAGVVVPFGRR